MTVFLDTWYLIALLRTRDALHEVAKRLSPVFVGSLVTTDAVLIELLDSMTDPVVRPRAVGACRSLRAEPRVRIVEVTPALLDDPTSLFERRADKGWGLTDCVSFVVMERAGIRQALTADHHFEQAGFLPLMK